MRYLAGHYTLEELGPLMRGQGAQVGMDAADRWIALTDAGQGLEHFIDVNFPRAVKIVDFRHTSEYVNNFAKAYRAGKAGEALAATWCHKLKHEGGAALLAELALLDRAAMCELAQAEYDKVLSYLGNHWTRMDYPTYLRKGWQIGTGAVESACKTVVNQRLSMGGMRWSEEGSDAVCHLRALFCSARTNGTPSGLTCPSQATSTPKWPHRRESTYCADAYPGSSQPGAGGTFRTHTEAHSAATSRRTPWKRSRGRD